MRTRTIFAIPTALAAGALLAGCTAPVPPEKALADAFAATGAVPHVTVTAKLDTTTDDLTKLVEAASTGQSASTAAQLDPFVAIVPKIAITTAVHAHSGDLNSTIGLDTADVSVAISVDGKPLEFRWVDSLPFVRADVEGIGQATGLFTGTQVKMMASQLTSTMPWVTDLIEGKWMTFDEATVAQLLDQIKNESNQSAQPQVDPVKARDALLEASTVTKVDDSTFKIATDAKKMLTAVAAVSDTDDFTEEDATEAINSINDGADLDTTVTVKDGKVTKIVVDIADVLRTWPKPDAGEPALAAIAGTEFKLDGVIEVSSDDPKIEVPQPATTIPASDIDGLIGR